MPLPPGRPLARADITELHCIQPIANVASIMERGILSHKLAEHVPHESVAMEEIQERRARVVLPGTGRRLHEYANLYINGRNKMLSKLTFTRDLNKLCVLQVSPDVLDLEGVVIADHNASSDVAGFAPSPRGLSNIIKEQVFARSWKHPGESLTEQRHGQIVCAEVLVPDKVAPAHVVGAYVVSEVAARDLRAVVPANFPVTVNRDLFFR